VTARTAVEALILQWEEQGRALLTSQHAAAELRDALEQDFGIPQDPGPYVMHYTGQHEKGTGGEWTVYRTEADPYPAYGPGEFTATHGECVAWIERHS